jgi:C4-dicarboxylate-specific signal transduction histidine kinase
VLSSVRLDADIATVDGLIASSRLMRADSQQKILAARTLMSSSVRRLERTAAMLLILRKLRDGAAAYTVASGAGSTPGLTDALLAALPVEIAILNRTGTIIHANEAWTRMVATEPDSVECELSVGGNYLEACRRGIGLPADVGSTVLASLRAVLRGSCEEFAVEYPALHDGRERWIELRVRRLGHVGGAAVVMQLDVSARRQAEAAGRRQLSQIAHRDRVASVGQLASSIAHELKQPLTAIRANAQAALRLLEGDHPDLAEVRACLADIISDDQRAGDVIAHMRRLLKKTDAVSLPIRVNDLVANTIDLVAKDAALHSVVIAFSPATGLPVVHGDAVQIEQVVLNLLTNAITAAAGGPSPRRLVTVWTAAAPIAAVDVEIGVHDSGSGIPHAHLDHVFDPFFTTTAEGLGMGLAISRAIIEAHGGYVPAANDRAGGATLRVHLPAARTGAAAATVAAMGAA